MLLRSTDGKGCSHASSRILPRTRAGEGRSCSRRLTGRRSRPGASPPFPVDSWLVCFGDDHGSLIEVMPWGAVREPTGGVGYDRDMRRYSGSHLLVRSRRLPEDVLAIAAREEWRAESGSAGLFQFTKVWVENIFLLEIMTPKQASAYVATFNAEGLGTLDHKLRQMEKGLLRRTS